MSVHYKIRFVISLTSALQYERTIGERRRLESSYERSYARSMLDQSQPRVRSDGERDRPAGIWCSMSCLPINGRNRHRPRAVPFIMPAIRNTRMHSQRVDQIGESGVIAILRGVDPESAIDVATAVIDGGVTALEVTADTPNVAETIGSPLRSVRRRARRRWDGSRRRDRPSGTARGRRVPRYADGRRRRHRDRKSLRNAGCDRRIHSDRGHSRLRGRRRLREGVPGRDWRTGTRRGPRWPAPQIPLVPTGGVGPRTPVRISRREPRRSESEAQSLLTMPSRTRSTRLSPRTRAEPSMRSRPPGTDSPSVDQAIRDRNSEIRSVSRWVARETAPTASSSIDRSPSVVQSSRRRLVPSAAEADREDVSLGNRPPLPCGARF